ncbi:MAG: hypothetical protein OXQ29_12765 [Rhodospirillaceae bacterium]|nr:hypothetical protein [Rhodospirillaceae bacterium]
MRPIRFAFLLVHLPIIALTVPQVASAQDAQQAPMTFFVTSEPIGDGGNLGGLAGADAHCRSLAQAAGEGQRTWVAYLSTQARPGAPAVNARDRIGEGPWYAPVRRIDRPLLKSEIHGDTLLEAQRGSNMFKLYTVTENGEPVNGIGDPLPTRHDILTGSRPDGSAFPPGEDRTCNNWTSNAEGAAQVGHSDRVGHGNTSWNSSHATTGCSQEDLVSWGGVGLFYCFAVD